MRRFLLLCALAGCGASPAPISPGPRPPPTSEEVLPPHHYRLELEDDAAALTLWLPSSEAPLQVDLPQMSGRDERRRQVEDVRCDGAGVPQHDGWRLPMGCRVLRWRVRFLDAPAEGVDPAELRAVRNTERRWWYLPGAAAFLRPDGSSSPGTVDIRAPEGVPVFHRLPRSDRLGYELPQPPSSGRVLIGFGGLVERETSDGATTYRHLYDREPVVEPTATSAVHAQAAAYLASVTGMRPAPAIDVFWFGRDPAARAVSGAAGVDAVAAAFLVGERSEDAPAHARYADLLVLLHEQVHLLVGSRLPAWASESLAHYYALKALVHAGAMPDGEMHAFVEGAAANAGDETLLASQQAYVSGGPAAVQAYTRFYTAGAKLWLALDDAIRAASEGARSLDDVVHDILGLVFVEGGAPPQRFLELLHGAGLAEPETITRPYLGWP